MEALAAVMILRDAFPDLRIRFVNVVDLMRLQDHTEHPHGLPDADFDSLFTRDKPVIFAYHGYPWLIHRLTYRRTNHGNFHVRGYKEEGTTTTPFDMTVMNQIDRFNLAMDVIDRVPRLQATSGTVRERLKNKLIEHRRYVRTEGEDLPEIREWQWGAGTGPEVTTDDAALHTPRGLSRPVGRVLVTPRTTACLWSPPAGRRPWRARGVTRNEPTRRAPARRSVGGCARSHARAIRAGKNAARLAPAVDPSGRPHDPQE